MCILYTNNVLYYYIIRVYYIYIYCPHAHAHAAAGHLYIHALYYIHTLHTAHCVCYHVYSYDTYHLYNTIDEFVEEVFVSGNVSHAGAGSLGSSK